MFINKLGICKHSLATLYAFLVGVIWLSILSVLILWRIKVLNNEILHNVLTSIFTRIRFIIWMNVIFRIFSSLTATFALIWPIETSWKISTSSPGTKWEKIPWRIFWWNFRSIGQFYKVSAERCVTDWNHCHAVNSLGIFFFCGTIITH